MPAWLNRPRLLAARLAESTGVAPSTSANAHLHQSSDTSIQPDWFTAALAHRPTHSSIDVDGCVIHLRSWGDPALPSLVLVHGGGAHSGWWDHIAPLFANTHHVIAPDLSGHGRSGWRDHYSMWTWAREVIAVSTATNPAARPVLVGHSMGGWVTAAVATRYGAALEGILVIDTPLRDHEIPEESRPFDPRGYPTRAEIVRKFRLIPPQAEMQAFVRDHVAAESVLHRDGEWHWRFDPTVFAKAEADFGSTDIESLEELLVNLACRAAYMRCENGAVTAEMADRIQSVMQLRGPFVELPVAGHHPMFDQPLALVAQIRMLLEMWSIT